MEKKLVWRIETLSTKHLVGNCLTMSLSNNRTPELWRQFMRTRSVIAHPVGTARYSLQQYPPTYFSAFDPAAEFVKWAAVEVMPGEPVPAGMQPFRLEGGLYAVFSYRGPAGDGRIFETIHRHWLPGSGYELAHRPHFEVLGDAYQNNHPDSEEEIWIPIQTKG